MSSLTVSGRRVQPTVDRMNTTASDPAKVETIAADDEAQHAKACLYDSKLSIPSRASRRAPPEKVLPLEFVAVQ